MRPKSCVDCVDMLSRMMINARFQADELVNTGAALLLSISMHSSCDMSLLHTQDVSQNEGGHGMLEKLCEQ